MSADDDSPYYGRRSSDRLREAMGTTTTVVEPPIPRLAYIHANAFEACIAVAAIIGAATSFVDPSTLARSAIGQVFHPWDYLWNGLYLLSGCFILAGLALNRGHAQMPGGHELSGYAVELAGLIFLLTAMTANMIAIVHLAGWTISIATFVAITCACVFRMQAISATRKLAVPVEAGGGRGH